MSCNHVWKTTVGFNKEYKDCEKCGMKYEEFEAMVQTAAEGVETQVSKRYEIDWSVLDDEMEKVKRKLFIPQPDQFVSLQCDGGDWHIMVEQETKKLENEIKQELFLPSEEPTSCYVCQDPNYGEDWHKDSDDQDAYEIDPSPNQPDYSFNFYTPEGLNSFKFFNPHAHTVEIDVNGRRYILGPHMILELRH